MNNKIIEDLAKLGIYQLKNLSEKEYNNLSKNNTDNSLIYINGCYEGGSESHNKYYKEINTKGLTIDDIKLQLEVERTKDIRFIKNAVIVLAVGIIITLILTLLIGLS